MPTPDARFRRRFATLITAAWAVSFVLDAVVATYDPPAGMHTLMLAVAGWTFGRPVVEAARRHDKGNPPNG